jgi:hypothetical protein
MVLLPSVLLRRFLDYMRSLNDGLSDAAQATVAGLTIDRLTALTEGDAPTPGEVAALERHTGRIVRDGDWASAPEPIEVFRRFVERARALDPELTDRKVAATIGVSAGHFSVYMSRKDLPGRRPNPEKPRRTAIEYYTGHILREDDWASDEELDAMQTPVFNPTRAGDR